MPVSKGMRKFVALYDLHFGWERGMVKGKWTVRPTFNLPAIKATCNFIKDFEPDILILGGDQLNCGPISHWHHGKPILDEGFRLKKEMDILSNTIIEPFSGIKEKVWLDGNHEQWIYDFIEANPGIEGLIEPQSYLQLDDWDIYSQGEVYKLGKLNFVHGDAVLGRGSGVNPARTLINAYRKNIRAGHVHTFSGAIQKNAIDSTDWHSAIIVPSLSSVDAFWVKGRPTNFVNGFLYGYVYPDGHFSDQVMLINKGEFTFNGKLYKP